jgi:dolichol kinase
MNGSFIALALPPLLLVPAMGLLSAVRAVSPLQNELRRKALHVLTGLMALGLPYVLREACLVLTALVAVSGWMLAVRRVPALAIRFGCVLQAAGRLSYGELYFALALAVLLLVCEPGSVRYVVPVLVLTLADTAAAVVGRALPWLPYGRDGNRKTLSGTLAFVATAFAVCALVLGAASNLPGGAIGAAAMSVAIVASLAEAFSSKGLDNLTVPVAAWCALNLLIPGV